LSLRVDRFGCFGKLPVSREFLVGEARGLAESRFDRWIGEGLGIAKMLLGARYDEKVTSFPAYWFVWGAGSGGKMLAGRLAPSEDGAGRKHPFALFGYCDARNSRGIVAASFGSLTEALDRLWTQVLQAATPAEILERVRQEAPAGNGAAAAESAAFLAGRRSADFWADRAPLRFQVMQAFVETLAPIKGRDLKDVRMGMRFPLSGYSPAACAEAAFWIDMTSRRLGKSLDRTSCFWTVGARSEGDFGPPPGDLYLFFSEPSGPQWTCLADRDANIETMSFLDRPYGSDPERRMEPALRSLLESPSATLADYLQWAGRRVMT
jgi:type VI secretion system ImpM family protein